jgi:alkylhydroperoxidase family enzyme
VRPWTISDQSIEGLRSVGFTDLEIFHAILGCAHFNYLNRMADGLGIRLEYASALRAPDLSPERAIDDPVPDCARPLAAFLRVPSTVLPTTSREPASLIAALGANPDAQALTLEWHRYHLRPTDDLGEPLRLRAALLAARLAGCEYLSDLYGRRLEVLSQAPGALEKGHVPEDLGRRERVILHHVARLSLAPGSIVEQEVEELRAVGCSDVTIVRLTMLAAYVSYESRVSLGLGIPVS